MSANPTSTETLVAEIAVLFGGHRDAAPGQIDAAALADLSQRQLLEAARLMGLTTVSRLKKDALVDRLWQAWQELLTVAPNGQQAKNGAPLEGEAVAPVPHKFEQHPNAAPATAAPLKDIPWGYGKDRVTAMAVDPDRLFVYWEVTEQALERARKTLGAAAEGAWLNLRIFDTTGRIFDGWNAHAIVDQGIDRGARQWFFTIGKPSSEAIVEIGLLARDGGFAKIARSSRVEFPRRDPVAWTDPEWLTVRVSDGQVRRGWLPRPVRAPEGGEVTAAGGALGAPGGVTLPVTLPSPDIVVQIEEEGERVVHHSEWHGEWEEVKSDGYVTGEGRLSWEEQGQISSWSEGPFPYPVEVPEPVRETSMGRTRVFRSGARTHVVYGPWQVVIHGLGATRSRAVISRWEVYRSWGEEGGRHVVHTQSGGEGQGIGLGGASERLMGGASERVWRGASEVRLGGSSELYYLGASELRLVGASERMYTGSSERLRRGASERRLSGEAQWVRGGASDERLAGEGERDRGGGSEGRLGGSANFPPRQPVSTSDYPHPPANAEAFDAGKRDG